MPIASAWLDSCVACPFVADYRARRLAVVDPYLPFDPALFNGSFPVVTVVRAVVVLILRNEDLIVVAVSISDFQN
jgi:hypothetical protein